MSRVILLLLIISSCRVNDDCINQEELLAKQIANKKITRSVLNEVWPENRKFSEVNYTKSGLKKKVVLYPKEGLPECLINEYDEEGRIVKVRVSSNDIDWEVRDSALYNEQGFHSESYRNMNSKFPATYVIENNSVGSPVKVKIYTGVDETGLEKSYWSNECQRDSMIRQSIGGILEEKLVFSFENGNPSTTKTFGKKGELMYTDSSVYLEGILSEQYFVDHVIGRQRVTKIKYVDGLESEILVLSRFFDSQKIDSVKYRYSYFE